MGKMSEVEKRRDSWWCGATATLSLSLCVCVYVCVCVAVCRFYFFLRSLTFLCISLSLSLSLSPQKPTTPGQFVPFGKAIPRQAGVTYYTANGWQECAVCKSWVFINLCFQPPIFNTLLSYILLLHGLPLFYFSNTLELLLTRIKRAHNFTSLPTLRTQSKSICSTHNRRRSRPAQSLPTTGATKIWVDHNSCVHHALIIWSVTTV